MRTINELESKGVLKWGGDPYAEIVQLSQEAETFFIAKDYVASSEKYTTAIAKANELGGRMQEVFQHMMEQGRLALDERDGELAQEKFGTALLIDPADESARHGLERAKKIEIIIQFIESGKRHEKNANLSFAHTDYQEAVKLDPESEEAKNALARIKDRIKKQAFLNLMSEGLAAFHNNNYEFARDKLLKAKSFEPESREVKDALEQVDQAIRLARIEILRKNADKAEKSENWQQALKFHQSILKLDQNVRFALQGKEWSLKNIRIEKRINFFLQNPKALESDIQLGNAVLLSQEIEGIEPKGPRLKAQLKELTRLVEAAQSPVKIAIESDNLTDVAVYKVGKLGRFSFRELSLRAGTYTVVGVRNGYKDVRKKIVIKPGQEPLRITVKCKVRI
jgi:tetratricopeptide (TPR) repeat protein